MTEPQRRLLNGVVYKFRSGCQWNRLPKELGDDSTIHRAFQRWVRLGVFARVWAMLEEASEELGGVARGDNGLTGFAGTGLREPVLSPSLGVAERQFSRTNNTFNVRDAEFCRSVSSADGMRSVGTADNDRRIRGESVRLN